MRVAYAGNQTGTEHLRTSLGKVEVGRETPRYGRQRVQLIRLHGHQRGCDKWGDVPSERESKQSGYPLGSGGHFSLWHFDTPAFLPLEFCDDLRDAIERFQKIRLGKNWTQYFQCGFKLTAVTCDTGDG